MIETINDEIIYLGPQGTFAHKAGQKLRVKLGLEHCSLVPADSISKVCEQVALGRSRYGISPFETSISDVNQALKALLESPLTILGEEIIPITQCLYFQSYEKVRFVESKPEAIDQCRENLRRVFPHLDESCYRGVDSTAKAVNRAAKDATIAAIGSKFAARELGLENILIRKIGVEDLPNNATRFIAISNNPREVAACTGRDKTTFFLQLRDEVGSLSNCLIELAKRKINLAKIRSLKKFNSGATFLMTIDGHIDEPLVRESLDCFQVNQPWIKYLGSYSEAEYVVPQASDVVDIKYSAQQVRDEMKNGGHAPEEAQIIYLLPDEVGALAKVALYMAEKGINLTAVNSLSTRRCLGEYIFYLAFNDPQNRRLDIVDDLERKGYCERAFLLDDLLGA